MWFYPFLPDSNSACPTPIEPGYFEYIPESRPTRLAPSSNIQETLASTNKVNVFPNPFTDQITISSEAEFQKIELIQANGQVLNSAIVSGKEFTFETSQLINGIYFLQVTNLEGIEIIKIIK